MIHHQSAASHPRAFVLLELLIVLGLLAIIATIAMRLLRSASQASVESALQQEREIRFDSAVRQLRQDVWSATSLESRSPSALRIATADGRTIEWNAPGALRRTQSDAPDPRLWDDPGASITLSVRGPSVIVQVEPSERQVGSRIVLLSESMLLTGRAQ